MRALVTGAEGFVGSPLCLALEQSGVHVRKGVRGPGVPAGDACALGDLEALPDWASAVQGMDVVIHLAARVHVMRDFAPDPLALYRTVNVDATTGLARAAAAAGVRRLVFMSSVKVNGERSLGPAITELDPPAPADPYGVSKLEAELQLREIGAATGIDVVIVRSPLVYGPGVRGNFLTLLRAVDRERLLPLGAIENRRSLIGLTNLVSALTLCATHAAAAGELFLVSDGPAISVPDLVRATARALGRRARLVAVPVPLLRLAGALTGRSAAIARLCDSLEVDASHIRQTLGWTPPSTVAQELTRIAQALHLKAS
jgi:nucleoside-diphosphate-sugar epimerase